MDQFLTGLLLSTPVLLTLGLTQAFKIWDRSRLPEADRANKDKKGALAWAYPWVAIVLGLGFGYVFAPNPADVWPSVQAATQNAGYVFLIWTFKKGLGLRFPGDPKES